MTTVSIAAKISERDRLFAQCQELASRSFTLYRTTDPEHGPIICASMRHNGKEYELAEVESPGVVHPVDQELRILRACLEQLNRGES